MNRDFMLNSIKNHLGFSTDKRLADFLGIKPNVLSNWRKRNVFDSNLLYTKCDFLNPEWLLLENAEMLRVDIDNSSELVKNQQDLINLQREKIAALEVELKALKNKKDAVKTTV